MKIEARNLLADAILTALDNAEAAAALRCLAAYCNSTPTPPTAVSVETLCAALPVKHTVGAASGLRQSSLLSWETCNGKEVATLVAPLIEDYRSAVVQLLQYAGVLTAWSPGEGEDPRSLSLRKAVGLFNSHLFFEVHEVLEEQWKQEEGDIRIFFQGLIQVAVAFHHLRNGNYRGATALLRDGLAKIRPYQPEFLTLELRNFIRQLEICQQELQRHGPERFHWSPEIIPQLTFVR